MTLKNTLLAGSALFMMGTAPALAEIDHDALVAQLQASGYTHIEITVGPTQTLVEAVNGGFEYETIFDAATGAILFSETSSTDEDPADGMEVEIEFAGADFLTADDLKDLDDDAYWDRMDEEEALRDAEEDAYWDRRDQQDEAGEAAEGDAYWDRMDKEEAERDAKDDAYWDARDREEEANDR